MSGKIICQNKKAYHDYFIEETIEAGISLLGCEVKSMRLGRVNLKDSYARVMGGEVFLINTHISPYAQKDTFGSVDPERTRKLLLHKIEIGKLIGTSQQKGYTIVPLKIYFKGGRAKVLLGIAKGKKLYDKRETLKKRAIEMEMRKAVKRK